MKRMKRLFLPLFLILTLAGCSEKVYPDPSAFVFGSWYGFCLENCIHLYKLENGKLYPDDMDTRFQSETITFESTPLEDKLAKKAEELLRLFPSYLRKNPNTTIGCPDCYDQGVIYLGFEENGKLTEWKIDPDMDINDYPQEIEAFMVAMKELIAKMPR
jgi:hypothetical protein